MCAVLPKGWFVSAGKYGTGGGGWMYIEYDGPGASTLGLYEGTYCATKGGCDVAGSSLGAATLGPLEGELYPTADGYAVVVGAGESPSWYLATTGLDQATTVRLARTRSPRRLGRRRPEPRNRRSSSRLLTGMAPPATESA